MHVAIEKKYSPPVSLMLLMYLFQRQQKNVKILCYETQYDLIIASRLIRLMYLVVEYSKLHIH